MYLYYQLVIGICVLGSYWTYFELGIIGISVLGIRYCACCVLRRLDVTSMATAEMTIVML